MSNYKCKEIYCLLWCVFLHLIEGKEFKETAMIAQKFISEYSYIFDIIKDVMRDNNNKVMNSQTQPCFGEMNHSVEEEYNNVITMSSNPELENLNAIITKLYSVLEIYNLTEKFDNIISKLKNMDIDVEQVDDITFCLRQMKNNISPMEITFVLFLNKKTRNLLRYLNHIPTDFCYAISTQCYEYLHLFKDKYFINYCLEHQNVCDKYAYENLVTFQKEQEKKEQEKKEQEKKEQEKKEQEKKEQEVKEKKKPSFFSCFKKQQ